MKVFMALSNVVRRTTKNLSLPWIDRWKSTETWYEVYEGSQFNPFDKIVAVCPDKVVADEVRAALEFYAAMAPEEGQGFFKTVPKLSDSLRYLGEYPCNEELHPVKYVEGFES